MRPLARIVLALSLGLASEMLIAQEPAPQGTESAAPVPAPIPADGAGEPEATITAPADPMPTDEPASDASTFAALLQDGDAPAEAMTPTPGPPVSQNSDRVEPPPPPPPAAGVDVALGSVDDASLGPSGRKSDWFFVAAIALAVAGIATKLLHTRSERVSIHEDRRLGGLS